MPRSNDAHAYSTVEVARRLGISLQTVQRWVDSGRLKAWKTPGGHRRIDAQSARQLFDEHRQLIAKVASDAPDGRSDAGGTPAAAALKVVIVDDNALDRELMATLVLLAWPQAVVHTAANGFEGLVLITRCAPDIVVTDMHMPHMDGLALVRHILANEATRPRLLVAVSAKSRQELAGLGVLPAEVRLLGKPLSRDTFVAALATVAPPSAAQAPAG